jgi:hypothetical protein
MERMVQPRIAEEKMRELKALHTREETQALLDKFKAPINPFKAAEDPKKISDLFFDKGTKRFFDEFEATREEKKIPATMMEMPFEQVKRIKQYIQEETARNDNSSRSADERIILL